MTKFNPYRPQKIAKKNKKRRVRFQTLKGSPWREPYHSWKYIHRFLWDFPL